MKTQFLVLALSLVVSMPAMATKIAPVAHWDCVINNKSEPKESAYAHRAMSTMFGDGHHINFRETVPSPGYTTEVKRVVNGKGVSFYVNWQAPEGMAAMVMGEGSYGVHVPKEAEAFVVHVEKSFNYGPEKIVCQKAGV